METLAIGTPLYSRDRVAYVSGVTPSARGVFVLGSGRMEHVAHDYEVTFADHVDTLSDGIVAPWLARAVEMRLEPITPEEVATKRAAALAAQNAARDARMAQHKADGEARQAFKADARGKIPPGAKAVIVGELVEDDCDMMTDYHNSITKRAVILAWSTHPRDLFPELRKAALNCPETAFLANAPDSAEHREKYSMGGGYYLKDGYRHNSGWKVCKRRFWGEDPAEAIPSGEWFIPQDAPVTAAAATCGPGGFTISEHVHSAKGFRMWIVSLAERVSAEEFNRLRDAARAAGGWYSRPWARSPGGFAFKSEEAAKAFAASLGGDGPPDGGESVPVHFSGFMNTNKRRPRACAEPAPAMTRAEASSAYDRAVAEAEAAYDAIEKPARAVCRAAHKVAKAAYLRAVGEEVDQ